MKCLHSNIRSGWSWTKHTEILRWIHLASSSRSSQSSPKIETRYFKLPDEKLIITRQITSDSTAGKDGTDLDRMVFIPKSTYQQDQQQPLERQQQYQRDALDANGSEVVVTENDDMDKVYVTNLKNRRFKIPALGGYDPEEDFKHASEDIEKPAARRRPTNSRRRNQQPSESRNKDISFNDPEADELFNDASEVDEVTFAQDDPYQTDLEEEMKGQEYDKPGTVGQSKQLQEEESEPRTRQELANKDKDDDDSESAWVNDGVDDMDIPSQSHQDNVLDKAAKQEALARRAAEDEAREAQAEAEGEPNAKSNDESSQRMPNAEYLKDDLKSIDDVD